MGQTCDFLAMLKEENNEGDVLLTFAAKTLKALGVPFNCIRNCKEKAERTIHLNKGEMIKMKHFKSTNTQKLNSINLIPSILARLRIFTRQNSLGHLHHSSKKLKWEEPTRCD